jgi:hypothetical protein
VIAWRSRRWPVLCATRAPFLLRTPAIGGLQRGEGWTLGVLAKAQSGALGL